MTHGSRNKREPKARSILISQRWEADGHTVQKLVHAAWHQERVA